MARSLWNGSISFGLVNIPINLISATEPHRVGFHEFEQGTKNRIHYRRVAGSSDREVPWEKIEKGFEVAKDRYVVLTDEEIEAAEPQKSHTVDIERFVPLAEIDPVNWDKTYYVAPDSEAAAKAYGLLRQAMQQQSRVAIGRFVMRTKEYVVCVRPLENILALQTMYFPDEVRSTKDLALVPHKANVGKQELALASQLIDAMAGHWDPSAYEDTFKQRVMELVHKKDKGEEIAVTPPTAEKGKVVDLMEALKATLAGAKSGKATPARAGSARRSTAVRPDTRARPASQRKPAKRRAAR
ncbi:MAG TPA: Ku protein [Polyangia bacterium]|jgi:DNA end-binding protein Ku